MQPLVLAGLDNIAEVMGCSKKTLCKWIQHKHFPAFKMDGVWRAMPKDIEHWLALRRADAEREKNTLGASDRPDVKRK